MKISNRILSWFIICIITAIVCVVIFEMQQCINEDIKEREKFIKDNPVEYAKQNCYSDIRGSRPACWTEGDWIEFCRHVECKQR